MSATSFAPRRWHRLTAVLAGLLTAFAVGAIAQAKGVQILQPVVLALLVICLAVWLWIPKLPKVRAA